MRAAAVIGFALALVMAAAGAVCADRAIHPGELVVEAPTLLCLGVRWYVSGDEDGDAAVKVTYRRKGELLWRPALPLFRVGTGPDSQEGEARLERGERRGWPFALGNLFAGSIFDLKPGTAYEIKLALSDPDGGGATRVVQAETRAVPAPPRPKRTLHVTPGDGGGTGGQADPLRGLAAANAAARPGDLILLHAGVYQGTFTTDRSGEPGAPIVWRGAGDGEAAVDGQGNHRGISANGVRHVFFQKLSIRNADYGMVAHGASELVVQACHFYQNDYGFTAHNNEPVMRNFYIADNVFEGPSTWPRTKGIENARAIQVSGEGHAICCNRIRGFGDGIDVMGGPPARAIDFYQNEISECTDDAIELDYGQSNVRTFRNRITNCFQGISTQPLYGGPAYIFRNAMYNLEYTPFKMHNNPSGALYFHNTSVKSGMPWPLWTSAEVRNALSRNNLFVGTGADFAMEFTPKMTGCDFDYDGFGGGPFGMFAKWNGERYAAFDDFCGRSGIERHAVLVDAAKAFASGVQAPQDLKRQFPIPVNDLRLNPGCAAVDGGVRLPNLNDGYRGKAPDLGAYELGAPLPHYGPRM